MVSTDTIPDALKDRDQWICWTTEDRDGKPTKVPIDPVNDGYASVSDPDTWGTYSAAETYYDLNEDVDGLGYVFTEDGPYAGVDIDDARNQVSEMVEEWVVDVLMTLQSYTERSPSGTGYHVIVEGAVPEGGNRRDQLEMYDDARFFTVTGDHVDGTPGTIEDRSEELQELHAEYIADNNEQSDYSEPDTREITLSDAELLKKAINASNADKFRALWNGDTSGYPSHSEADLALCNLLAYWTGGDQQRIERLFSKSGLVREKWQERPDYRERTIKKAVRDVTDYYDPQSERSDSASTD
ncbi:hypothetical protein HT576_08630 [Haloterrigena sp. SYSU A121-1]|uniref:NrS-1 polymerase-like HBD domain-containing protein n=2 Tax=Haloterrigena gelatinilytica TaxID=2741724 RepID=A0A8J8GJE2_9EURY|nr:hypothetical protein [Haloterrigena gelatinilytica]